MKSKDRNPKSERNPKTEIRIQAESIARFFGCRDAIVIPPFPDDFAINDFATPLFVPIRTDKGKIIDDKIMKNFEITSRISDFGFRIYTP